MTRRRLVAGNWKMYGSVEHVDAFADALAARAGENADADLLVCPPFVYIERLARRLEGSGVAIGGQNVCDKIGPGAFTGEVSAAMLADLGCTHAIVGHSERRALYGEDDETVAEKFELVRQAGLTPILCVGETLAERDAAVRAVPGLRVLWTDGTSFLVQTERELPPTGPADLSRKRLASVPLRISAREDTAPRAPFRATAFSPLVDGA